MPQHHLQPSFSGGEISPSLYARVDTAAYATWLKRAHNFFIHPQGGASNRPGTIFVGTAKYTGKTCRLLPFIISEEEAYVLEWGEKYLRVYTSAGQILDNQGDPYELLTPYTAQELEALRYTQYDQMLYLTHPNHPPKRLVWLEPGRFRLEDVPLKYGPFQLSNTQATRQMRVVPYTQQTETAGASASLSFLPQVDPAYFVQGYFNGNLFFTGHGYGLDVHFLVEEFNRVYGPSGFEAFDLGGVIKLLSPQSTGGDWNGATFVLEYRNSFVLPPAMTVVQTLTGGVNAGALDEPQTGQYILESDFDVFSPQQVGGRFSITHRVENQYFSGTLGYDTTSSVLSSSGDWRVRTSGSWTGQILLEKSTDLGTTWQTLKTFARESGDDNIAAYGRLEDTGDLYYFRLRANTISGEAGYELEADSFVQEGIVVAEDFISARKLLVTVEQNFASQEWSSDWAEGSFSPKNGYPACVFFYQDRLGLAGTRAEAQTIWFSKTGKHMHFGHGRETLADDDSISVNLSGKKLNAIQAVSAGGKLLVFTSGSEWTLSAAGALTPYNVQVEQQGERGASHIAPVMVGNRVLYVQARGGALRDFYYDYNADSYTGGDVTLLAKHLFFNKTIREMCYQQEPDNLVWCVLSDGQLACLTYVAEQNLCAWTHHSTQGSFVSVCTIPNRGYDEVWVAVKRANGYFVERFAQRMASKLPQEQLFLDASVTQKSGTAFTEVTGLDHLEGEEVRALADGSPLATATVSDGKITLPRAMNCVHVGLAYESQISTLPVASQVAQGTKRRVVSVLLKLTDSRGGLAGLENETSDELIQRFNENFNTALTLKTGEYLLPLAGAHGFAPSVVFAQQEPLPVTVLAILCQLA